MMEGENEGSLEKWRAEVRMVTLNALPAIQEVKKTLTSVFCCKALLLSETQKDTYIFPSSVADHM